MLPRTATTLVGAEAGEPNHGEDEGIGLKRIAFLWAMAVSFVARMGTRTFSPRFYYPKIAALLKVPPSSSSSSSS